MPISDVVLVVALTVATHPEIDGLRVGIVVVGSPDGAVVGARLGAEDTNNTQNKTIRSTNSYHMAHKKAAHID